MWRRCRSLRILASLWAAATILLSATAFASEFPFENELLLDVKPLRDSKRVPILEITPEGRAIVDLWCKSGEGRAEVGSEAFTLKLGALREENCTPERLQLDRDLATALEEVTQWEIEDGMLVLTGRTELRFRLSMY